LATLFTVNTMPGGTVKAFADHGGIGDILPADGGDCEDVLEQFAKAGIDIDALANKIARRWRQIIRQILGRTVEGHFGQQ
jgi:transaldolase